MRWTSSDALNARDARVIGGEYDGLFVAVSEGKKGLRYPDVFDLSGYDFDRKSWAFVAHEKGTQ